MRLIRDINFSCGAHGPWESIVLTRRSRLRPARALGGLHIRFKFFGGKVAKSWWRIWSRGKNVDLPIWQRPAAMAIILGFYGIGFAGEISSAIARTFEPIPKVESSRPQNARDAKTFCGLIFELRGNFRPGPEDLVHVPASQSRPDLQSFEFRRNIQ